MVRLLKVDPQISTRLILNPNFDIPYDVLMVTELNQELVAAFLAAGDNELEVVDPVTRRVYVLVDCETHRQAMEALRRLQNRNAIGEGSTKLETPEERLERLTPSNDRLLSCAKSNPPGDEWYDEEPQLPPQD